MRAGADYGTHNVSVRERIAKLIQATRAVAVGEEHRARKNGSILWDRDERQLGVVTSKVFDGELSCAALVWPEELGIHVSPGLDISPGVELICPWWNAVDVKVSPLVGSRRLVKVHTRPQVAVRNQDDLRAADRQFVRIEHQAVNLRARMAELKCERAQRLAARNREARLQGPPPVDVRALQIDAIRGPQDVHIERTFWNIAERESAVGLHRGKAEAENGEMLARVQIDTQSGQIDLPSGIAVDVARQSDPRRQGQGGTIDVRVAHVQRLPGTVLP